MQTKEFPVETFVVRAYCDECGEELRGNGMVYDSYPPIYELECKNHHKETSRKVYPATEHRLKDNAPDH